MANDNAKLKRSADFLNREIEKIEHGRRIGLPSTRWARQRFGLSVISESSGESFTLHSSVKNEGERLDNEAQRTGGGPAPAELTTVELKLGRPVVFWRLGQNLNLSSPISMAPPSPILKIDSLKFDRI